MTYEGGDMDEYLGGTPYVCSNDEEYTNACLYMPNGTLMYCQ